MRGMCTSQSSPHKSLRLRLELQSPSIHSPEMHRVRFATISNLLKR
jgi:hypothetical protein